MEIKHGQVRINIPISVIATQMHGQDDRVTFADTYSRTHDPVEIVSMVRRMTSIALQRKDVHLPEHKKCYNFFITIEEVLNQVYFNDTRIPVIEHVMEHFDFEDVMNYYGVSKISEWVSASQ